MGGARASMDVADFAFNQAALKAAGIDLSANEHTVLVHLRGTW